MHDIAIAGGGIGGLTAACGLLKAGHRVRVFEQAPDPGELGAGLSIAPNAAAVLKELGLRDQILALSNLPQEGRVFDGRTGELLSTTPYGEAVREHFGDYYYQTPRTALYDLLASTISAMDPDCIHTAHRVTGYGEHPDDVSLSFDGQPDQQAEVLIGADGLRSVVRSSMLGEVPARFTRYIAWRALIPLKDLPESYQEACSNVWIGPQRNFVFYPLAQNQMLNCAMFAGDSDWTREGWRLRAEVSEIRQAYAGFHATVQTLIDALPAAGCYKWALFDRDPLPSWHSPRVALLGDAAHPMLPFLGQGASMALEDAAELIHALGQQADPKLALAAYQAARLDRANWVLLESRAAGERFASPNPSASLFSNDQAMQAGKLFGWKPPGLA